MHTPSCIRSFSADKPLISHSAALLNPAPGLQNSCDTAPIAVSPLVYSALPLPGAAEHNPPVADENVLRAAELLMDGRWVKIDLGKKWQVYVDIC